MQEQCNCGHLRVLPVNQCFICTDCGPEPLLDLCFKYIIDNIHVICNCGPFSKTYKLNDGIILPNEICDKFLAMCQRYHRKVDDRIIAIFHDRYATRLKRVSLVNSPITDSSLKIILQHRLEDLELINCEELTDTSLYILNKYSSSLQSLTLSSGANIIPADVNKLKSMNCVINAPQLKRIALHRLNSKDDQIFTTLLRSMTSLTHLDLSECSDLAEMVFLKHMPQLSSLVLYNVSHIQRALHSICAVTTLRHLDLSQSHEDKGDYEKENKILSMIIEHLPYLESLDISGTNLAGSGVAESSCEATDIPGLAARATKPLRFLGLLGTAKEACRRHHIPAQVVTGDANEQQILVAAMAYVHRPELIKKVLNDLFHLFRYETCQHIGHALSLVLQAMDRHPTEKHIQISGSATLFYIVKGKEKVAFGVRVKRHIISTLLNAMYYHKDDDTMMRNGCLTLCQFKIPQDVLFEYERLVKILLHSVSEMEQEGFVQRIGIYLLNSLACQVDGKQKQRLGDLGVICRMLGLIADRLGRGVCDDVLEVAWSTMWNVTDETPFNCRRFLDSKGMEYFLGCLNSFPNKEELLRNMMGLLGNVAEVKLLRPRLMTSQYVEVFSGLLDSSSDGIEVSYNAAGVLAHMASDGPSVWMLTSPSRSSVLTRMTAAIERWDLNTERNINYRSFEPILHLVKTYHTPECQYWAVWALANLTNVYPAKYCSLIESEGGLNLLSELLKHESPPLRVKELARIVINNCRKVDRECVYDDVQLDG